MLLAHYQQDWKATKKWATAHIVESPRFYFYYYFQGIADHHFGNTGASRKALGTFTDHCNDSHLLAEVLRILEGT